MDYLTCLGYNPPKASIRIIASSSSRLRGCRRPSRDLASTEKRKERNRREEARETKTPTSLPASHLVRRLPLARLGMSPRYRTRAFRFFPPIVRGTRRDSDLDSKSRNYKYYLIIIKASKK